MLQLVLRNSNVELKPSLEPARSNCTRLSCNWCDPMMIEALGLTPPSTNAEQVTPLRACTIEFAPAIVLLTFWFYSTKSLFGTLGPALVLFSFLESWYNENGATGFANFGIPRSWLVKNLVKDWYIGCSRTMYGFIVMIFVPPAPALMLTFNEDALVGTCLLLILIDGRVT